MQPPSSALRSTLLALLTAALAAGPALADKGGKGHGNKGQNGNPHDDDYYKYDDRRGGVSVDIRFGYDDRRIVTDYYGGAYGKKGHCPPGLAKKGNGCMPPGQAKKWAVGRPLPADVRYYPLPRDLEMRLRPAPPGYRYVQVAGDVLMIAVGTAMVADALTDLMR
jgi:Ni/Co efflux regulator RcnB